jgi:hypothetical protein
MVTHSRRNWHSSQFQHSLDVLNQCHWKSFILELKLEQCKLEIVHVVLLCFTTKVGIEKKSHCRLLVLQEIVVHIEFEPPASADVMFPRVSADQSLS